MDDAKWRARYDAMPVTGDCDAHCGKPATKWFGLTSCATCGDRCCESALQDSYDREGEKPDFGPSKNSTATKEPTMIDHRGPVHRAFLEHLDHLLNNLLPFCAAESAAQVLAAGLATVRAMHDLALIDGFEAAALIDRVHTAYAAQITTPPDAQ